MADQEALKLQANAARAQALAKRSRKQPERPSAVEGGMSAAAQGFFLGAGDEINAGLSALLGAERQPDGTYSYMNFDGTIGERYNTELAKSRVILDQFREDSPVASTGLEIGGAMLLPGGAIKSGATGLAKTGRGLLAGGAAGAVYGFNAAEGEDRPASAALGAGLGGLGGAASPHVGGLLERAANTRLARKAQAQAAKLAPSMDDMRQLASQIYQRADTVGIPSDKLASVAGRTRSEISRRPINPSLTPRTAAVMNEVDDVATAPGNNVLFGELQDLRQRAGVARADFSNPAEQRGGAIIQNAIDDFVSEVDPDLSKEVSKARDMWSRLRKSEQIQEVIERAERQASGFENGLRIGLRQILNNSQRRAGFTAAEVSAMEQVVKGTRFGNVMKKVGRLSFGAGQQTNVMSGMAGMGVAGGLGSAALGPVGLLASAVTPVIGYGAKKASERSTQRGVDALRGLVASGGTSAPVITQQARGLLDDLALRTVRSQGVPEYPQVLREWQTQAGQ